MHPQETSKAAERPGRCIQKGAAKDFGLVQFAEKEASGEGSADLSSFAFNDIMCSNGSMLYQGRFRLDIRKYFFYERVVKH